MLLTLPKQSTKHKVLSSFFMLGAFAVRILRTGLPHRTVGGKAAGVRAGLLNRLLGAVAELDVRLVLH